MLNLYVDPSNPFKLKCGSHVEKNSFQVNIILQQSSKLVSHLLGLNCRKRANNYIAPSCDVFLRSRDARLSQIMQHNVTLIPAPAFTA